MMNLKPLTGASRMSSIRNMVACLVCSGSGAVVAPSRAGRLLNRPHDQPEEESADKVDERTRLHIFGVERALVVEIDEEGRAEHEEAPHEPHRHVEPEQVQPAPRARLL